MGRMPMMAPAPGIGRRRQCRENRYRSERSRDRASRPTGYYNHTHAPERPCRAGSAPAPAPLRTPAVVVRPHPQNHAAVRLRAG